MTRVLVLLIAYVTALSANPVMEYFLSEIQVAPDSLERIEVHMYSNERPYPVDLSGWSLTTNAGIATIDSGIALQDSGDFVIISRDNVSGPFALDDDSDEVSLEDPYGGGDHYAYGGYGWTPPPGVSAAIYTHVEGAWPYSYLVGDWYIDSTPTIGQHNDDYSGGIEGRVLDWSGQPPRYCWVRFENVSGAGSVLCETTGRYVMSPLGPGVYEVSAHGDSTYLPAYYPESVSIGVNGWEDSIDMTMYPAGVVEVPIRAESPVSLRQRGRTLVLAVGRPGTVVVSVYDNLGRVRMSEKVALVSGKNELDLPSLTSGVYFVSCRLRGRALKTKIVLY
jgi:hypothetical protein